MEIEKTLRELPDKIRDMEIEILNLKFALEELSMIVKLKEQNIKSEIANETDGGKKRFSNESLRSAELSKRVSESNDISVLTEDLKRQDRELKVKEIGLKYLYNLFSAVRNLVRLKMTGEK